MKIGVYFFPDPHNTLTSFYGGTFKCERAEDILPEGVTFNANGIAYAVDPTIVFLLIPEPLAVDYIFNFDPGPREYREMLGREGIGFDLGYEDVRQRRMGLLAPSEEEIPA